MLDGLSVGRDMCARAGAMQAGHAHGRAGFGVGERRQVGRQAIVGLVRWAVEVTRWLAGLAWCAGLLG